MPPGDNRARVSVSAIVTAYKRIPQTLATLRVISQSSPAPQEILVHVDGNQQECAQAIREAFPDVRILVSADNVGPGGGRNRLIAEARTPYVASFDDDSYPTQADFFARVVAAFERHPRAAILAAGIFNRGETPPQTAGPELRVANFVGCGCVYRKSALVDLPGYVPLPIAYGMEEVDMALQLIDRGGEILQTSSLHVLHDTDFGHHQSPAITAHSIANVALLAFLRYPPRYWPLGAIQVMNRVRWLLVAGRIRGVASGVAMIPGHLYAHRHFRRVVSAEGFRRFRELRKLHASAAGLTA